jgi:hypothetical protein
MPVVLLFAAIGVSNAHAQVEIPTFTCTSTCDFSTPTATNVTFPSPATITETWDSTTLTISLAGDSPGDEYHYQDSLYYSSYLLIYELEMEISDTNTFTAPSVYSDSPVPPAFFTNPTVLEDTSYGTLSFAPLSATPEPGTFSLMLIGLGSLVAMMVMRKR